MGGRRAWVSWGRARGGARGRVGFGGRAEGQMPSSAVPSISGGGAAPPVQRSRQSALACSARHLFVAPGRSGGRARGGTGLGAGSAPLRTHLQLPRRRRGARVAEDTLRVRGLGVAGGATTSCAAARGGAALRGRGGGQGRPQTRETLPGRPPCPPAGGVQLRTATWVTYTGQWFSKRKGPLRRGALLKVREREELRAAAGEGPPSRRLSSRSYISLP